MDVTRTLRPICSTLDTLGMAFTGKGRLTTFLACLMYAAASQANLAGVKEITVVVNDASTAEVIQLGEVIAIDAHTGTDKALASAGATVEVQSIYSNHYLPAYAIDGNNQPGASGRVPFYASGTASGQWLKVTLATPITLARLDLVGRGDCCFSRDIYDVTLRDEHGNELAVYNAMDARGSTHIATIGTQSAALSGKWGDVMHWPLVAVSMANLPDGRILTYSGSERRTWPTTEQTYSATWDPLTNQFDETLHVGHNMFCAATSMTEDGKVFVNGGRNAGNSPWTSLYDYATNSWTQIENMASGGRWYPTSLALGNGSILTAMGYATNVRNPDLWTAGEGWRVLNGIDFISMRQRRNELGATPLFPLLSQAPDGSVYHFWDTVENHHIDTSGNGSATPAHPDTDHHDHAGGGQVMYDQGKLLITGSNDGSWGDNRSVITNKAFTVDLNGARPVIRATQPMNFKRKFHQMIPLPTGEVLTVGGNTTGSKFQDDGSVMHAEIWNPQSGQWRVVAAMSVPRDYHSTALMMVDGRVITAGGGYAPSDPSSSGTHQDAQIYSPPYLFQDDGQLAQRPSVQSSVAEVGYGQSFSVTTSDDISYFSLIKMSSTSHAINTDLRFFKPDFTQVANGLYSITMHNNPNVATPGYWMLYAVDSNGVPSIADVIQITADAEPPNNGNPPEVEGIVSSPVQTGSQTEFSVNATGTSLLYSWNFGDGSGDSAFSSSSTISHTYATPGRYIVSVTVRTPAGDETISTFTQVVHGELDANRPSASAALVELPERNELWNVNPDNNSVGIINTETNSLSIAITVGNNPRTLALAPDNRIWVVNKDDATISVINSTTRVLETTIVLDRHSRPHGIVFNEHSAYVALEGTDTVVQLNAQTGIERRRNIASNSPRHLSLSADGRTLLVTSFITPPVSAEHSANPVVGDGEGAQIWKFTTNQHSLIADTTITLGHINRTASENQGPGLPNYLGPAVQSPDGRYAMVPSKQDNILRGTLRNNQALVFDQTVRAVTSLIDLTTERELLPSRVDHDNASVASHASYGPYGLTLFTSLEGNRQVALIDTTTNIEYARFDTGHAPQSLLLSDSGDRLFVHNFLDRSVGIYDISAVVRRGGSSVEQVAVINTSSSELLPNDVHRGKQLFYDARDDRLAALDYMSCASCHNEGGHDGRSWDFTSVGEGVRNTLSLKGTSGMAHGLLHWTANFDELQDFEGQIRSLAGGTGLLSDELFEQGTRAEPLGDSKAGLSADLDALAAYLQSLDESLPSPHRNEDGTLTAAAQRGQALFASKGCAICHAGTAHTDSSESPLLHNIGTVDEDSGERLGEPLTGIDTPTLNGVWATAPYLHDGSAQTLEQAIAAHADVSLSANELSDLGAYVQQLAPSDASNTTTPSNPVVSLQLDGRLSDWSGLASFGVDADDISGSNDPLDWREGWMAHDNNTLYIAYRNDGAVDESWGQTIYVDTDSSIRTGFRQGALGADYVFQGQYVYQYTGDGNSWQWEFVRTMSGQTSADMFEYALPRSDIGNPTLMRLAFVGSNEAYPSGSAEDYYPDGFYDNNADTQYFEYSLNGPVSNVPVANGASYFVESSQTLPFTLSGADFDNNELSFTVVTPPANGNLSGTAPELVYTPAPGYAGVDTVGFSVNNGSHDSAVATISITVYPSDDTSIPSNFNSSLTLDGNLSDWIELQSFGPDADDVTGIDNPIDYLEAWMAHDEDYFYVAYRIDGVEIASVLSWGFNLYLDTDTSAATGFSNDLAIGADYLLQGGLVFQYTGDGSSWSWAYAGDAERVLDGSSAEVRFPRISIGNVTDINLVFAGDNISIGGNKDDLYPDTPAGAAPQRQYLSYSTENTRAEASELALGAAVGDIDPRNGKLAAGQTASKPSSTRVYSSAGEQIINTGSGCAIASGGNPDPLRIIILLAAWLWLTRRRRSQKLPT